MEYTIEHIDPETGEITETIENWMTVTEYGKTKGVGSRKVRAILVGLGLLQQETEIRMIPMTVDPSQTKPDYRTTPRLTDEAVEQGLGKRLYSIKTDQEFDVLSPRGQLWADDRWPLEQPKKIGTRDVVREQVRSLLEQGKSQAEIINITRKSRQLVSHHIRRISDERIAA